MNVYLNSIVGVSDAITSMYMSKRTWTRDLEEHIRLMCDAVFDQNGKRKEIVDAHCNSCVKEYLDKLFHYGVVHQTLLRYVDFSFTVEGLHRGATDDFDSHAKRLENRIIRSSTRLASFGNEMSDWYKGKIITTDEMIRDHGITIPDHIVKDGCVYVKTINGYVREDLTKDHDALRGLYMLSIPMSFIFKVNCTEFAHILKERDVNSHAAPELRAMIESCLQQINAELPMVTRELLYSIRN